MGDLLENSELHTLWKKIEKKWSDNKLFYLRSAHFLKIQKAQILIKGG